VCPSEGRELWVGNECRQLLGDEARLGGLVQDHRPQGQVQCAQAGDELERLENGKLLGQRHHQGLGERRVDEQVPHPRRLVGHGARRKRLQQHLRDAEKRQRMPSGRRVHHQDVPSGAGPIHLAEVPENFSEHHCLGQRGDEAEEGADQGVFEHRSVDALDANPLQDVFTHGFRRAHVDTPQLSFEPRQLWTGRGVPEKRRGMSPAIHLAEQRSSPALSHRERQRSGDRALSHPAFSGDDEQPGS
jgi:hypothetical protein